MMSRYIILLLIASTLCACNPTRQDGLSTSDNPEGQNTHTDNTNLDAVSVDIVIASYEDILTVADDEDLRRDVLLRLADLEIERQEYLANNKTETSHDNQHDYRVAIRKYHAFLQAYPDYSGNDHVLYQLAKAYELDGDIDNTLKTLREIVGRYPSSPYVNEANFRRGEIQFVLKSYSEAAKAYADVISTGDDSYFYEKALYKQGWSLYRDGHMNDSLRSFTDLLDRKLADNTDMDINDVSSQVSIGDRELLDDTLRVISLIFSSMNDSLAVTQYFSAIGHRNYEYLVYHHLGEFYLAQERIKDAADTYYAFAQSQPQNRHTPFFELRAIEAYKQGQFTTLLLQAKEGFVDRYHAGSTFWASQSEKTWESIFPHVKQHADELARYYHALAQKTGEQDTYARAQHWYQIFLTSFPDDPASPKINFLFAELLFENRQYTGAVREYEKTAYDYNEHDKSAEAGYAALLAYHEREKELEGDNKQLWRRQSIASTLRFAERYPKDGHVAIVLTKAASDLFDLHDNDQAAAMARRIIDLSSRKQADLRHTAWTIIAHTAFEAGAFDTAEDAYVQALKLTPNKGSDQTELQERLAAAIYKQGENARNGNNLKEAAAHFLRVGETVPTTSIRSTAEYDAATIFISIKDWNKAISVLERFRQAYPQHPLQADVTSKLAVCYLEDGNLQKAAVEFEVIAATNDNSDIQRDALMQAATLYQKVNDTDAAINTYSRYISSFPQPLDEAMEVHATIAALYAQTRQPDKQKHWLKQIIQADRNAHGSRTDRSRFLASQASLQLAKFDYQNYQSIKLTLPLEKTLKKKKQAMESSLEAYNRVLEYNIAAMTTAASYQIAVIYTDFSKALLNSQRPRGLSDIELEQYDILLEEQAFPFEEEAIAAHEINALRVAQGIYDDWVKKSFDELAKLLPVRYAKAEKGEESINELK